MRITGGMSTATTAAAGIVVFDSSAEGDGELTLTRIWVFDNHNRDANGGGDRQPRQAHNRRQPAVGQHRGAERRRRSRTTTSCTIVNSTVSGNRALGEPALPARRAAAASTTTATSPSSPAESRESRARSPTTHRSCVADNTHDYRSTTRRTAAAAGSLTPEENCQVALRQQIGGDCEGPSAYALFHNTIVSDNTADGDDNCSGNFAGRRSGLRIVRGLQPRGRRSTCLFTGTGDKLRGVGSRGARQQRRRHRHAQAQRGQRRDRRRRPRRLPRRRPARRHPAAARALRHRGVRARAGSGHARRPLDAAAVAAGTGVP